MVPLSPIFALVSLVILITAIVALSKNTPTWLRLHSRKAAIAVTAASAVAFLVIGGISSTAFSATLSDGVAAVESPAMIVGTSTTTGQTALVVLATLEVKGRAPKTGYDRDQFGQRWLDVDHNGCDTRNDTLARDLTDLQRSGRCRIMSGTLEDPFTGQRIAFERGQDTSRLVQIDHVVSLSDAWQKGGQQLTADQRATFANDPLNLLAVSGAANAQKGDGDAATWLPKNKAFRCEYVARQVSVKAAYRLWVTPPEHDAIAGILEGCSDEPALTSAYTAKATTNVAPPPPAQQSSGCDSNYADACVPIASDVDCAGGGGNGPAYFRGIARVVGSDIYKLDRDHDGYACEPS